MAFRVDCQHRGPERAVAPAGAAHKINMDEIRAEKDREINELKGMVTDVLERVGIGYGPLSEYEAKKARLKEQDESDTRHACD